MIARSAVALCACLGVAAAQPPAAPAATPASPPPFLSYLPAKEFAAPTDRALRDQAWAMVGREDRLSAPDQPPIRCTVADADPLDMIAKAAADAQIVIVNEASDHPQHRALVEDIATRLAPLGFTTYAGETLLAPVSTSGPPRMGDGVYANEPAFGRLLRTLRRLGYRLAAYESEGAATPGGGDYVDEINRREALQTSNLVNRVFLADRNAKVLVHVTYGHNREDPELVTRPLQRPRQILFLARRLKDILGVDPLTIDQTTYVADRDGVCFTDEYGRAPPTGRDMYVAHASPSFERGRPAWRLARGQRLATAPARLLKADGRIVLEARRAADPADAVPADRILVDPGESLPLLLEPGAYKVRAWTEDGAWSADVPLTVSDPRPAPPRAAQKTSRRKKR